MRHTCKACGKDKIDNYGRCRTTGCELELKRQFDPNTSLKLPNREPWKQPSKQSG